MKWLGWLVPNKDKKEDNYFKQAFEELKLDKERLLIENKGLQNQILTLNKQIIELLKYEQVNKNITTHNSELTANNSNEFIDTETTEQKKLAPKEKEIFKLCDELKNYKNVLELSGMKDSSLKVYISRIRKKNYKIEFETI
jgi:hypothetical protein